MMKHYLFFSRLLGRRPSRLLAGLLLLLALGLVGPPARAQMPTQAASRRYWNTSSDSLRRVLAGQHADTARLRTLRHLSDLYLDNLTEGRNAVAELAALTGRLRTPDHRAYRQWLATYSLLRTAPAQALDSLHATIAEFDRLGRVALAPLLSLRLLYNNLNQREAKRTYYQARLTYYRRRGAALNIAACYHTLGGYYAHRGDYNQALGYYLRAAELFRPAIPYWYYNEMAVVGYYYEQWGNYERALPYLQRVLAYAKKPGGDNWDYANRAIAHIYLRQHRYAAALHYANQSLLPIAAGNHLSDSIKAYGLVTKSAVLLAQGRVAEAGRLLPVAQHLADSLQLPINGSAGAFELDATWARYYAARHQPARAEAAWLAAYRQAQALHTTLLRLAYLRELGYFYQQQGQPARAAPYALAAVALADSLEVAQSARHVAQYEIERADRAQQARIAGLRLAQVQDAARARRQRLLLGAALAVLALVAGLGYVLWRAGRRQRRANEILNQLNAAITAQKQALQTQRDQLDASLTDLRATQQQLIQKEKMASLGELTAGIAHEIQNPLNFVNNFAEVSTELAAELAEGQARPVRDLLLEMELVGDLQENLTKIHQHGQRAASIVRGMLAHSRGSSGERQLTDVNALADEYLRLAYQGLRARNQTFSAALTTAFAPGLPLVEAVPGDLGRVLLNLFNNAFYAVQQRQQQGAAVYVPTISVRTRCINQQVEIQVQDNGTGMSPEVQAKIFQPFFTTKPAGQGTGLGLSLSYDIVIQGHGGRLTVESAPAQGSTFYLSLPLRRHAAAAAPACLDAAPASG